MTRRLVVKRRLGWCQKCGSPDELTVHHITPRRLGGTDHGSNLMTLCRPCHDRVHERNGRLTSGEGAS